MNVAIAGTASLEQPLVSIVIPAYNEQENVPRLERELSEALGGLPYRFEFVVVDNDSSDATGALVTEICARDPRWKYVRLTRNFGAELAITAGYRHAAGDAIVVLYSDLQEPPAAIPAMLAKWREGYDIVHGVHVARHGERAARTLAVRIAYRLVTRVADAPIRADASDFRLITAEVRDALMQCGERVRYLRGLVPWLGFRQGEIRYERRPRTAGESKMRLPLVFSYLTNGIVSFSFAPLRTVFVLGALLLAAAATWGTVVAGLAIAGAGPSDAALLAILGLALAGVNLLAVWIVGEYAGRAYFESVRRPAYLVAQTVNVEPLQLEAAAPRSVERTAAPR